MPEDEFPAESFSPWTVVNLVFHHLAGEGLHPTLGGNDDPGRHAAALLRSFGIAPTNEGDARVAQTTKDELAELRAVMFDEPQSGGAAASWPTRE